MKNKKNAIIFLAAGFSQEKLIIKAKSLGYYLICIDKDSNSVGFKYSDKKIVLSTHKAKPVIGKLKLLYKNYNFSGIVLRSSGPPVITASKISKFFKIPGVPIDSARSLVSKDILRLKLSKLKLPISDFDIFSKFKNDIVDKIKLPVVIKPSLSLIGKKGITVVRSKNKIKDAFNYAIDNCLVKKVIFEEYLSGPDITFVSFVNNGKLFPVCVLDEINYEDQDGKIISNGYKTHYSSKGEKVISSIKKISNQLIKNFKILRSPLIISFRYDDDKTLKIIEVHLDLGGDLFLEELFPRMFSFDYNKFAIEMSIGLESNIFNNKIKPTGILYEKGKKLLNRRKFKIIENLSDRKLDSYFK